MMNLSIIRALGKMHEWGIHCRGAISKRVTQDEIRAFIHVIGIYCGVPQALECSFVAQKILRMPSPTLGALKMQCIVFQSSKRLA